MLYAILAPLSLFIRNFYMPNPFEPLGEGVVVFGVLLAPVLLNWIFEPILHIVSFAEVGLFYDSGDAPAIGSILYFIVYFLNTGVLWIASCFGLHWYTNVLVFVAYVAFIVFITRSIDR